MNAETYKEFLDSSQHAHDCSVTYVGFFCSLNFLSRLTSLGIAFGIAGSVFVAACGAAFKYVAEKVEEERSKLLVSQK